MLGGRMLLFYYFDPIVCCKGVLEIQKSIGVIQRNLWEKKVEYKGKNISMHHKW